MTRTLFSASRACAILAAFFAFVAAAHGQKPPEPWDHLKSPAFTSAYTKALGPKAKMPWLAKRDGPAPLPTYETVEEGMALKGEIASRRAVGWAGKARSRRRI